MPPDGIAVQPGQDLPPLRPQHLALVEQCQCEDADREDHLLCPPGLGTA